MKYVKYLGAPPVKVEGQRVSTGDVARVPDKFADDLLKHPDKLWGKSTKDAYDKMIDVRASAKLEAMKPKTKPAAAAPAGKEG